MLVDIKSFLLFAATATESDCIFDGIEDNHTHNEGESNYCECAESLYSDRAFNAVDGWVAEYSGENGTEDTAYSVYADCTYRIVNLHDLVDEAYREAHRNGNDDSDDCCCPDIYAVATCCDANESSEHTVADH